MVRGIRYIQSRTDDYKLEWQEDWHNIAFSLSKKKAEGVDIEDEAFLETPLLKMMDSQAYDRLQIETAKESALVDSGSVQ